MNYRIALTVSTLLLAPAAVQAQTAAPAAPAAPATTATTPPVGASVNDSAGAVIGTVVAVTPQAIVIDTGTNKVPVPPTSVGKGAKGGWHMELTKAQLDAAADQAKAQAQAQAKAALVPGAQVHSRNGAAVVGTIKAADDQYVTLTTEKGDVKFPASGFTAGPSGVVIGFTAEEFAKAIGGAAAAPAPAPDGPAPGAK